MYLLEKKEKSYDVYEFNPIKEKVREYKENEMKKIPQENTIKFPNYNKVLKAITNDEYVMEVDYPHLKYILPNKAIEYTYHDIIPSTDKNVNEEILNDYYNEVDNSKFDPVKKMVNNNDIFLIPTKDFYDNIIDVPCYKVFEHIFKDGIDKYMKRSRTTVKDSYVYYKEHKNNIVRLYEMDDIINIPESLYNYHRFIDFLNGLVSIMEKEEIKKLLPLFKMSKEIVKKFDIEEVQKLDSDMKKYMRLNNYISKELDNKCHRSEKILSLVKKN